MSNKIPHGIFKFFNFKNFVFGLALLGWLILTVRKIQVAELNYVSSIVKSLKRAKFSTSPLETFPRLYFMLEFVRENL
jgi:hypothetical protein